MPRQPAQTDRSNRKVGVEEDTWSLLMTQEFRGVTERMLKRSASLEEPRDPATRPHCACPTEIPGGIRATDIWESEADFQAFAKEQLMPMAARVRRGARYSMDGS